MPVLHYIPFRQKITRPSLRDVTGGMGTGEVLFEVERGARFLVYEYVVSVLIVAYASFSGVS